jgi:hypothetical protein
MIAYLPTTCLYFEMLMDMRKGEIATCPSAGFSFAAPISMKAKDNVLIDMQTKKLEKVVREGITIWRYAWRN